MKSSTAEHTPEPWEARMLLADGCVVTTPRVEIVTPEWDVVSGTPGIKPIRREADAARIVACVNYCAGLSAEQMEGTTAVEYIGELEDTAEGFHAPDASALDSIAAALAGSRWRAWVADDEGDTYIGQEGSEDFIAETVPGEQVGYLLDGHNATVDAIRTVIESTGRTVGA